MAINYTPSACPTIRSRGDAAYLITLAVLWPKPKKKAKQFDAILSIRDKEFEKFPHNCGCDMRQQQTSSENRKKTFFLKESRTEAN